MKLLMKVLLLLVAAAVLAGGSLDLPQTQSTAVQGAPFAPPNASWAHLFAGGWR